MARKTWKARGPEDPESPEGPEGPESPEDPETPQGPEALCLGISGFLVAKFDFSASKLAEKENKYVVRPKAKEKRQGCC